MQVLEEILEEIEQRKARAEKLIVKPPHDKLDQVANDTAEAFIEAYKECQDIIRKYMNDGWIPMEERLPIPNKEIWVTAKRNGNVFTSTDTMTEKGYFWNNEKISDSALSSNVLIDDVSFRNIFFSSSEKGNNPITCEESRSLTYDFHFDSKSPKLISEASIICEIITANVRIASLCS